MIRKFHATNYMKGQIQWQLPQLVNDGSIMFEKGTSRNKCIIILDESKIDPMNLKYIYSKLIPASREIRDWSSPLSIKNKKPIKGWANINENAIRGNLFSFTLNKKYINTTLQSKINMLKWYCR